MKKLLLLFTVAAVAATVGCDRYSTEIYVNYWTDHAYLNESSSEITMHAFFSLDFNGGEADSLFVIPVKGAYVTRSSTSTPLIWEDSARDEDYVIISNGEKTVTHRRSERNDPDNLYNQRAYTTLYKLDPPQIEVLVYVFTDDFFENGEPVE